MRKSMKLLGAVAVAGLVVAGGSAFTASSTIDDPHQIVGAVSQLISGVTVSSVVYTTAPLTDITSKVTFHVTQILKDTDVVTATITGTDQETVPGALTDSIPCVHVVTTGTDLTCTFAGAPVSNVTLLNIVAS